jgi:hypothetical protein
MGAIDGIRDRFHWWLPFCAASVTILVCLLDALLESDGLLYFFLVIPTVSLSLFALFVATAIRKRRRDSLAILSMLAIYWTLSFAFIKNHSSIRNAERWSVWSHRYKAEVLAQANSGSEELKHVDWDGWGFPGAGDTTVYLVFDPTNSLAAAARSHHPGKFPGIPCTVPRITRMESQWYAVLFYTDERWGRPHWDCGMQD